VHCVTRFSGSSAYTGATRKNPEARQKPTAAARIVRDRLRRMARGERDAMFESKILRCNSLPGHSIRFHSLPECDDTLNMNPT